MSPYWLENNDKNEVFKCLVHSKTRYTVPNLSLVGLCKYGSTGTKWCCGSN